MKRFVSFSLFLLLLAHVLAHVITGLSAWWQAEHDLSERLQVYRTVDSIVEFQIPLANQTDEQIIAYTTEDGFAYHGRYYSVVSLEVRGNTLFIAGLESKNSSFWQSDLLSFLNTHLLAHSDKGRKANQLLKFLLKEYSPGASLVLTSPQSGWHEQERIFEQPIIFLTRSEPMFSPPPEHAV